MRQPTTLLYTEFWFLAHNDRTGRRRLSHRALGIGLAASLIADLLSGDHVAFDGNGLKASVCPEKSVLKVLWEQVAAARREHALPHWLETLAGDAAERVAEKLAAAGKIERGGLLPPRWIPTNVSDAGWPLIRLRLGVQARTWSQPHTDPILAGLVWATGMRRILLVDAEARQKRFLDQTIETLPSTYRRLVDATHETISRFVVANRV